MTKEEAYRVIQLLTAIKKLQDVDKIISTFIPPFYEKSIFRKGWNYLIGSFNLTGTKSGRMSSSGPNLQQLPSTGTDYAEPIKKCFEASEDWIMVGADYSSLEDMISALQTKDPNKLKVYTDGYDGHCLRAQSYFASQMPDIDPSNVESVNSIQNKYKKLRQDSKTPTFALTYQGTWRTLVKNSGFTEEEAKHIEAQYHQLYAVSDAWVQERLREASERGYATLAFGLRLRTPVLKQTLWGSSKRPYEAHKEEKTVGNALTQSYGLLTNRATNAFMQLVWKSEYKYNILPIAQIHDATYFLIKKDVDTLHFTNQNLIKCMTWNELPEIQHDTVKLKAELEFYWPTWADKHKIPNNITKDHLRSLFYTTVANLND
jgi:DNA polymerase-1